MLTNKKATTMHNNKKKRKIRLVRSRALFKRDLKRQMTMMTACLKSQAVTSTAQMGNKIKQISEDPIVVDVRGATKVSKHDYTSKLIRPSNKPTSLECGR